MENMEGVILRSGDIFQFLVSSNFSLEGAAILGCQSKRPYQSN